MAGRLQRAVAPVASVVHAARRPTTYRGHVREAVSTLITIGMWPMGFADAGVQELRRGSSEEGTVDTPVLLVHGYGANKSNWLFVRRDLHQAGFGRVHALNYNPLSDDIPGLAERCVARAEELKAHFGVERVHLVGHSLGGVIARYAVQVLGLRDVGVCITVASPHGGVRLAEYGSMVGTFGPLVSGHQLRPGSEVMTLLRYSARPLPTRFVAYYSNLDLLVPARRAMIVEPELAATNLLVKDHGHLSIMLSRRLARSIVDQLGAAEGMAGYGNPVRGIGTAAVVDPAAPPNPSPAPRRAAL